MQNYYNLGKSWLIKEVYGLTIELNWNHLKKR